MSLKSNTISALSWSSCERFSQQGIQFIVGIILARLLRPSEFGLIGMLFFFIALAQPFVLSSFGHALIQKQDANYIDECSVFYFNIIVGFFAAGVLCLSAPWISDFYNQPILTPLTQVLSLNIVFDAFGHIQSVLLAKRIDFKILFKVGLCASLASGVIGISMAYMGCGVWSLVAQSVGRSLMNTTLLWLFTSWRPALIFSTASLKQLIGFSSRLLLSGILDTIFQNIYLLIFGKLFTPVTLGYYTRAKSLQNMPVSNICSIVCRVTFPIFSSLQNDKVRVKQALSKTLTTLVMVICPLMIGLYILAEPLIFVVLGQKWLPSVPYLRLLCIIGLFWPLYTINLTVLNSLGRSDLSLRIKMIEKIMIVLSISITYRWGIEAMLWGQITISFVVFFLVSHYTGKLVGYTIFDQMRDFFPYLGISLIMGVVVFGNSLWFNSMFFSLLTGVALGMIFYFLTCKFFRIKAFEEFYNIVRDKFSICFEK